VIGKHYLHNILSDVPPDTELIHFCCDRYSAGGLKASEQHHRYARCRPGRQFEVCGQYKAPDADEFFSVSANKSELLNILCNMWSQDEQLAQSIGSTRLYLGGGSGKKQSVLITNGTVADVAELESTQQEADTRMILHLVYSVQHEGVDSHYSC